MASSGAHQHENAELLLYFLIVLKTACKKNKHTFQLDLLNLKNSRIWHTAKNVNVSSLFAW